MTTPDLHALAECAAAIAEALERTVSILDNYATSYDGMTGEVFAASVMRDIRENMIPAIRNLKPRSDLVCVPRLMEFALAVIAAHREDFGDLDGGWVQDKAEELGLLIRVPVTEPYGEICHCAEWDDFPQQCLRLTESVRAMLAAAKEGE